MFLAFAFTSSLCIWVIQAQPLYCRQQWFFMSKCSTSDCDGSLWGEPSADNAQGRSTFTVNVFGFREEDSDLLLSIKLESLDYLTDLLETIHLPLTGDKVNITCVFDMSSYDRRILDSTKEWGTPRCDGRDIGSVMLTRKCVPECSHLVNRYNNEKLAAKLLDHWHSGTIIPEPGDCQRDAIQDVPCCRFTENTLIAANTFWSYDANSSQVSVTLQCSNVHQKRVVPMRSFQCNSRAIFPDQMQGCKFDMCVTEVDNDSGAFYNSLHATVTSQIGDATIPSPGGLSRLVVNDLPILLVTCVNEPRTLKDFQTVECVYDNATSKWEWKTSSLRKCLDPGLDYGISYFYATFRMEADCFILPHAPRTRRFQDFCAEYGGKIYRPLPRSMHPSVSSTTLYSNLQPHGEKFWLGHSAIQGTSPDKYIEWLDQRAFFFNYTSISSNLYFANRTEEEKKAFKECFVLDVNKPNELGSESCYSLLRELCYEKDLSSEIVEWSEWLEWQPCYKHVRRRIKSCPADDSYCTGCDGPQQEYTEYCCYARHNVQHARLVVVDTGRVRLECYNGYKLPNGEQTITYTCVTSPDWQRDHKPVCLPEFCPSPPPPTLSSTLGLGWDKNNNYRIGHQLMYNCKPHLIVNGTMSDNSKNLLCLVNKTWSSQPPICVGKEFHYGVLKSMSNFLSWNETSVRKLASDLVLGGRMRVGDAVFPGDKVILHCVPGYEFEFEVETIRVEVGVDGFIGMKRCKPYMCEPAPSISENSYISSGRRAQIVGSSLTYQCLPGFEDKAAGKTQLSLLCAENRTWTGGDMLNCTARNCPPPPVTDHGEVFGLRDNGWYVTNDCVEVVCNHSYALWIGGIYEYSHKTCCTPTGEWSSQEEMQCKRVECPNITNLIRAEVVNPRATYYSGDSAHIRCYPNHVFVGTTMNPGRSEAVQQCMEDGSWGGFDYHQCYTYQLQFGAMVETFDKPGYINLTWLNTHLFRAIEEGLQEDLEAAQGSSPNDATYTVTFHGKDSFGNIRVNITRVHTALRVDRIYSMTTTVPPGFHYDVWVSASLDSWSESAYGEPHLQFYAPTGTPAFASGFTVKDMVPIFSNNSRTEDYSQDESTIELTLADIFSPVNGSVHQYTIIVIEKNEFLTDQYLEGTIEENLTTWAKAQEFPYWPPYLIHNKCQIFTGSGCPDIASGKNELKHYVKRDYTAKDPIFKGDDAFVSSHGDATGLEDVAITNDNLKKWTVPGYRQSYRVAQYTIGGQSCDKEKKDVYCNGKLRHARDYCIKLRAYTNEHYIDSPCTQPEERSSSLLVLWSKARILPFVFALIPLSILSAVILGVVMQSDFNATSPQDELQIKALRDEKKREKARTRWRNAIFKAYDAALTTDNDQAVNLLAVASGEISDTAPKERGLEKSPSRGKLEKKCSYFAKNRKWFEQINMEAYERAISTTTLDDMAADDELYDAADIMDEQHIAYSAFQRGQRTRRHQIHLRGSYSDSGLL